MSLEEEVRRIPFARICFSFMAGILLFKYAGESAFYLILTFAICIFFIHAYKKLLKYSDYSLQWLQGSLIYLLLILSGTLNYNLHIQNYYKPVILAPYDLFVAEVTDYPVTNKKNVKTILALKMARDPHQDTSLNSKILVYFEKDSSVLKLEPGDWIVCKNTCKMIKNSGNPGEFDFKKYMNRKTIYYQAYLSGKNWSKLNCSEKRITYFFLKFRKKLLVSFERNNIKDDEFAVLAAMSLGYRNSLDPELKQAYAQSGAMHILAVSGLHVGILYLILSAIVKIFQRYKAYKWIKLLILLGGLWFYAGLTGVSSSVLRAAILFSFFALGNTFQQNRNSYNLLLGSALIILLFDPESLFNVSFQLSYAAVASILFFQPKIYQWFAFRYFLADKIWALVSLSLAAQLGIVPLLIYYFHQFSNYFLLTNIILVPFVSLVLYLTMLLILSLPIGFLSSYISYILVLILQGMNYFVGFIEKLPYAITHDLYINKLEVISLYVVIMSLALLFTYKKYAIFYFLGGIILFLSASSFNTIRDYQKDEFIVYNIREATLLEIKNKKKSVFVSTKPITGPAEKIIKASMLQRNIQKYHKAEIHTNKPDSIYQIGHISLYKNFVMYKDQTIFICNQDWNKKRVAEKFHVNYLIIGESFTGNVTDVLDCFSMDTLIISPGVKEWKLKRIKETITDKKIIVHKIAEKGAFYSEW